MVSDFLVLDYGCGSRPLPHYIQNPKNLSTLNNKLCYIECLRIVNICKHIVAY